MKHKTSELEGNALDCAVAIADGESISTLDCMPVFYQVKGYSSEWRHGGPIIERERIAITTFFDEWEAHVNGELDEEEGMRANPSTGVGGGPTPLIAAMRAYVASKLGEEVELP